MRTRIWIICILSGLIFAVGLYFLQSSKNAKYAITFFPLDETFFFTDATTNLHNFQDNLLNWTTLSSSEKPVYLRQDVSLLYENGFFKGIQSKWEQDQQLINLNHPVPLHNTAVFEAISFHHGEIHQPSNDITSIQKMTFDKIYMHKKNQSFEPLNKKDERIAIIDQEKQERLKKSWHKWISEHDIDQSDYTVIPLTNLADYEDNPLPGLSVEQSKATIGKLWEGLYKEYILRLKEKKNEGKSHAMPIILLSKDSSHIYILFELDGQQQILLQKIPNVDSSTNPP